MTGHPYSASELRGLLHPKVMLTIAGSAVHLAIPDSDLVPARRAKPWRIARPGAVAMVLNAPPRSLGGGEKQGGGARTGDHVWVWRVNRRRSLTRRVSLGTPPLVVAPSGERRAADDARWDDRP